MIFNFDKSDKGFDSIFGNNLNLDTWVSRLPNPSLADSFGFDPALKNEIFNQGQNGLSYIGKLGLQNNITSIRTAIGNIASTLGYFTTEFNNLSKIYEVPVNKITLEIKSAVAILSKSGMGYEDGLNAIGAIPVVGWIIGIIVKVAQLVTNIIKTVQENNISDAKIKLISQFAIPLAQFNKDADEALTRICIDHITNGDMNYLFSPRYLFQDFDDFQVNREKNEAPDNILTRAFNITSKKESGIGFIPGTLDISSSIRLLTSKPGYGGASTRDVGDFYPTVRNLCISTFEQIQKPSAALFSIEPDKLSTLWETNIVNLLKYSELSLIKGWSGFQTGNIDSNTFLCADVIFGQLNCKKSKANENLKIPVTTDPFGHFNSFRDHIFNRFFNGQYKDSKLITDLKEAKWTSKNIPVKKSIPSLALKNIKDTQYAIINSLNCCYVSDEINGFAAIRNDSVLNKKWVTNVAAVLNSASEWKKLRFLDIPNGEFKNEIFLKATKAGFKDFDSRTGPIENKLGNVKAGPSILGDPAPPKPFVPVGGHNATLGKISPKSTSSKSESNLVGVMAIAALSGLLLTRK